MGPSLPDHKFIPEILLPPATSFEEVSKGLSKAAEALATAFSASLTELMPWPGEIAVSQESGYERRYYGFPAREQMRPEMAEAFAELQRRWHNLIGFDGRVGTMNMQEDQRHNLLDHLASNLGWYIQVDETETSTGEATIISRYGINQYSGAIAPNAFNLRDCLGFKELPPDRIIAGILKFLRQSPSMKFDAFQTIFNGYPTSFTIGQKSSAGMRLILCHKEADWEVRLELKAKQVWVTSEAWDRLLCALVGWTDVSLAYSHSIQGIPDWLFNLPLYVPGGITRDGLDLTQSPCTCGSGRLFRDCHCIDFSSLQ